MTRAWAGSSTRTRRGDGTNWYRYAGNDPINKTDPTGLSIIDGLAPRPYDTGFGPDPGGLFGGENRLDDFFASEDEAEERGRQDYLAGEIAKAEAALEKALEEANAVSTDVPLPDELNGVLIAAAGPKKPDATVAYKSIRLLTIAGAAWAIKGLVVSAANAGSSYYDAWVLGNGVHQMHVMEYNYEHGITGTKGTDPATDNSRAYAQIQQAEHDSTVSAAKAAADAANAIYTNIK